MPFEGAKKTARDMALKYGLKDTRDDKDIFDKCWAWKNDADKATNKEDDNMLAEIERQFNLFASRIAETGHTRPESQEVGHRYIYRERLEGKKYVIFSDHHWANSANRQNYFENTRPNNKNLYIKILQEYLDGGYTLIENGDVEELIIHEPTLTEVSARAGMTQRQLDEDRKVKRSAVFEKILQDNHDLYVMLNKFHDAGRFLKIAGNHDYNLQEGTPFANLANQFNGIHKPYDYVLLESADKVEFAILHGHQFDKVANPVYAPRLGETISECLAWAYQGADRQWRWTNECELWAKAHKSFKNLAVTDEYKHGRAVAAIGEYIGNLHNKDAWEALFRHNIAWEYFEDPNDAQKIFDSEVMTGKQFFKYRHMNEKKIIQLLKGSFTDAQRPKLVLGHSHEVRFKPYFLDNNTNQRQNFEWYYNPGSAGRFENLVWGLEITDGVPLLISWSLPEQNQRAVEPERRVYSPDQQHPNKELRASVNPVPL